MPSTETPPRPAPSDRLWALIPCAGSGSRAGTAKPKQYQRLLGQPLVQYTLDAFAQVPALSGVVLVLAPDDADFAAAPLVLADLVQAVACGGATRAQTVQNGLRWLLSHGASGHDWVLVHDAARCLITPDQIEHLIVTCQNDRVGGLLAQPLADTLKQAEDTGVPRVIQTLSRSHKWLAQTPQMFRLGLLLEALAQASPEVTDEAGAIESLGMQPLLVSAGGANFKVTFPEDFALAEAVLARRLQPIQES